MRFADLAAMVNARVVHRLNSTTRQRIVMVGLFDDATASYAERVAAQVGAMALVEPVTIGAIRADTSVLDRVLSADLVLTFSNLQTDVETLTGPQRYHLVAVHSVRGDANGAGVA